jgi:hypothetical protein
MTATKALLIPGDTPPTTTSLKRQLLFFDSLLVPTPEDDAIINKDDVSETFPNGQTLRWGAFCPYPKIFSYDDQFRMVRADAERATRTGKLQFIHLATRSPHEAAENWVAALAALKAKPLLRAALPDYQPNTEPIHLRPASAYGMVVVSATGFKSEYHWMTELDSAPAISMTEEWRRMAMGRLGRALKVVRRASADNSIPLAVDPTNQNICLALGAQAYGDLPSPQTLAGAAIALDTVDPAALENALVSMSWEDVFRLRKEVLPAVAKLRELMVSSVKAAAHPQNADLSTYVQALGKLKDDYRKAQDDASGAWRKAGFRTVEVTASGVATGLASLAPSADWTKMITGAAMLIVAKALGGAGDDFRTIMRSRKARKASPLFAFDRLNSPGEPGPTKLETL